jgi:hypothetical protein
MNTPSTLDQLAEINARAAGMLNRAQATIDEGLALAALTIAEADGKKKVEDPERRVAIARGMMRNAQLASFYLGHAIEDGNPTDAGLLRAMSGVYDA